MGIDQKSNTFWERIQEEYNNFRMEGLEMREVSSLKSRYYRMSRDVSLFDGCFKRLAHRQNWVLGVGFHG